MPAWRRPALVEPPSDNVVTSSQERGRLAQLVRVLARHARGRWFESTIAHHSFTQPEPGRSEHPLSAPFLCPAARLAYGSPDAPLLGMR